MIAKYWLKLSLIIPIFVLIGWILYEEVYAWTLPEPRWVISARAQAPFYSCQDVEQYVLDEYEITLVDDLPIDIVPLDDASDIIGRVVNFYPLGIAPTLVQANFPDNQQRIVWHRLDLLDIGKSDMEGAMTSVFIDAYSGESLMLVKDMVVFDPCMAGCDCLSASIYLTRLSRNQLIVIILLVIYTLVLGISAVLRRIRKNKFQTLTLLVILLAIVLTFGLFASTTELTNTTDTTSSALSKTDISTATLLPMATSTGILTPTPTLNAEGSIIKQTLLTELDWTEADLEFFWVIENTDQIAKGMVKRKDEINGAGWWAACDSSGQWVFAYIGHGIPLCSDIERPPFDFPKDWFPYCVDASGSIIER